MDVPSPLRACRGWWQPSTADPDQDFHVVLAGQPLEPVLQHGDVGNALLADITPPPGRRFLWCVSFARAFPLVTAWRRRMEHCKNHDAAGQTVWVRARDWGRLL